VRNLRRDPRIAISIVDPANPYRHLELRGVAIRIDADPDLAFVDRVVICKDLREGRDPARNPPGKERVIVVVEPRHITRMG
jgi:hypothetical protein